MNNYIHFSMFKNISWNQSDSSDMRFLYLYVKTLDCPHVTGILLI